MKSVYSLLLIAVFVLGPANAQTGTTNSQENAFSGLQLHFDAPAAEWNHTLPVGNGRLGAMIFGGTTEERIQFNEETLWSGGPYDPVVEGAHEGLPEIRRLMFAGEFNKAHDVFGRTMMGKPYEMMKYQPMGNILFKFEGLGEIADYRRELDLDRAVATTSFSSNGVQYKREVFVSAVDQVMVIRISADKPGQITFSANMHGVRNPAHSNYGTDYFQMDGLEPNGLRITGKNSDYLGIKGQLTYEARLNATSKGGKIFVDYRTLHAEKADEVTIYLAAATNFVNYKDVSGNPEKRVAETFSNMSDRTYDQILTDHLAEHRSWFRRVSFNLASDPSVTAMSLDKRLERFKTEPDPNLGALYYQFGRYLLIASSRPGTQPANLQGIWNDSPNPSWDSKYTVNINLPMNYWPADSGNLSELIEPLETFTEEIAVTGARTAKEHWNARGWVLHQNTDLWRPATPMDGPSWGAWPVGGAWIMTNLFDHYRFSESKEDLQAIYPLLKGQTEFLMDILVEHPDNGWMVTAPSNSPENFPAYPGNERFFDEVSGIYLKARNIAIGPTMDMQIIREVFGMFTEASATLGVDAQMAKEVDDVRKRLAPNQIGKHGQLMEWIEDFDEVEPLHRHLSHLWGLYPGSEITPEATPELAKAAEISIRRRGTGGCGWSYGWKMGLWARLKSSADALHEFRALLTESSLPNMFSLCSRTLQVDANFGGAASIAEMLVQSHQGFIDLLPALPAEWSTGAVSGLKARGSVEVDLTWADGKLTQTTLRPALSSRLKIRVDGVKSMTRDGKKASFKKVDTHYIEFDAVAGATYVLKF